MFRRSPAPRRARYAGPCAMNPAENPTDFLKKLLVAVLVWELVRFVIARIALVVLPKRDDEDEETARVRFEAPKQYTGAVHALVVSALAAKLLRAVVALDEAADMYYIRGAGIGMDDGTRDLLELTNWLFLGYLVQDTTHIVWNFPRMGKADMLAHHCVFMVASILSGASQTMMLPFCWLLLGEASTPLLTLRWTIQSAAYSLESEKVVKVAKAFGFKGELVSSPKNAGKQLEFFAGLMLVFTFFLARVVTYSLGYTHMLWVRHKGIIDAVPASVALPLNVLVGAGAGLNAHWFGIMIRKAIKGPPKPKEA
jgi:hypothetical protein